MASANESARVSPERSTRYEVQRIASLLPPLATAVWFFGGFLLEISIQQRAAYFVAGLSLAVAGNAANGILSYRMWLRGTIPKPIENWITVTAILSGVWLLFFSLLIPFVIWAPSD